MMCQVMHEGPKNPFVYTANIHISVDFFFLKLRSKYSIKFCKMNLSPNFPHFILYVYVNTHTEQILLLLFIFSKLQAQTYYQTLSKGIMEKKKKKEVPDLQTDSCNVVIWPGCLSAHTFAPGYQSHSTSLLKQPPSDTVPGKLRNQEEKEVISHMLIFSCYMIRCLSKMKTNFRCSHQGNISYIPYTHASLHTYHLCPTVQGGRSLKYKIFFRGGSQQVT